MRTQLLKFITISIGFSGLPTAAHASTIGPFASGVWQTLITINLGLAAIVVGILSSFLSHKSANRIVATWASAAFLGAACISLTAILFDPVPVALNWLNPQVIKPINWLLILSLGASMGFAVCKKRWLMIGSVTVLGMLLGAAYGEITQVNVWGGRIFALFILGAIGHGLGDALKKLQPRLFQVVGRLLVMMSLTPLIGSVWPLIKAKI